MFARGDESVRQSTEVLAQVAGLLLFTAVAVVLVTRLVTTPHPTPFELIRWIGVSGLCLFADVQLAVGLVTGRPLSGRNLRLDLQLTMIWIVLFLAIDSAVLAVAVAAGNLPVLTGSLLALVLLTLAMGRAFGHLTVKAQPSPVRLDR